MGQRCFEFFEFRRWSVYFNANDIGYFEHFVQNWRDVLQMSEKAVRASVPFAAEDVVSVRRSFLNTSETVFYMGLQVKVLVAGIDSRETSGLS